MKTFIKTILFLLLTFAAALCGVWINHNIIHENETALILEIAEEGYSQYKANFDPSRKTVLVIGRSTAIYSFRDNKENYDPYSFVDRLKENFNVFSLVSGNLLNYGQVRAVFDYAQSKIENPDLVIIENPVYLINDEFIEGENDFILWVSCWGSAGSSKACQNYTPFRKLKEKIGFSINPCSKKYQEELRLSYFKHSGDRKKVISKIMECGKSFNVEQETQQLVTESFKFGFAQDLAAVDNFKPDAGKIISTETIILGPNPGVLNNAESFKFKPDTENIKNRDKNFRNYQKPQVITHVELLFINKYMKDILKEYSWKKFIFIPHHAKEVSKVKELQVFQHNKDRVYFLDFTKELKEGPKTFAENFPDGTHPHFWIQNLMADKIYEISRDWK